MSTKTTAQDSGTEKPKNASTLAQKNGNPKEHLEKANQAMTEAWIMISRRREKSG